MKFTGSLILLLFLAGTSLSQHLLPEGYSFIKLLPSTPVKDQGKTGTCWNFSTHSFIESELMRMGKGEYDFSEMYLVRNIYPMKAEKYIRYHGIANFSEGGQAHDILIAVKKYGLVPEEVYTGRPASAAEHNHSSIVPALKGVLDKALSPGKVSPGWREEVDSLLDSFLGKNVSRFYYKNREYTPLTFAEETGFNPADYIELTSYSHHPFYTSFILEVPDNWTNSYYYNLPIDELMSVIDNSLEQEYTIVWDGDVFNGYLSGTNGTGIMQGKDFKNEMIVGQAERDEAFNDFSVTDEHLMHIIGKCEDASGKKYYYVKDSFWADNKLGGYHCLSEQYLRMMTVAVLVNKNAISSAIREKLGI